MTRIGWDSMLQFPEYIYPNLVKEFYANVVDKDKYNGNFIESYIRGRHLALGWIIIAEALGCWNGDSDVKLRKGFYTHSSCSITQATEHFNVSSDRSRSVVSERSRSVAKSKYFANKF